jgi:hypothetical protein
MCIAFAKGAVKIRLLADHLPAPDGRLHVGGLDLSESGNIECSEVEGGTSI